jgi:MoxR-like ATPase
MIRLASSRMDVQAFMARLTCIARINMAPPAMQGVAQQLILDRKEGSYTVPDGWYVWAAGNRKEDRAAVFDMPSPLANRFLHLQVESDFDSFKVYALETGVHEQIISNPVEQPQ